jgi:hypothetical protein
MKAKVLVVVVAILILSAFGSGQAVEAQVPSKVLPTLAVENLFAALSRGDVELALAAGMLEGWHRDGRQYEMLGDRITNIASGLELVTSEVEIADRGVTWGKHAIMAVVFDGQVQKIYTTGFRLTPSQYW